MEIPEKLRRQVSFTEEFPTKAPHVKFLTKAPRRMVRCDGDFHGKMGVDHKWGYWGTPKWMVYFMENPIKMDDLGVAPILGNLQM